MDLEGAPGLEARRANKLKLSMGQQPLIINVPTAASAPSVAR
jgi:hypothetical protein